MDKYLKPPFAKPPFRLARLANSQPKTLARHFPESLWRLPGVLPTLSESFGARGCDPDGLLENWFWAFGPK